VQAHRGSGCPRTRAPASFACQRLVASRLGPLPESAPPHQHVLPRPTPPHLQRFAWNEAKYPSRRPLKDIVSSIMETVQKLDDDLKVGGLE